MDRMFLFQNVGLGLLGLAVIIFIAGLLGSLLDLPEWITIPLGLIAGGLTILLVGRITARRNAGEKNS